MARGLRYDKLPPRQRKAEIRFRAEVAANSKRAGLHGERPTLAQRTYIKKLARETNTDIDTATIKLASEASEIIEYLIAVRDER